MSLAYDITIIHINLYDFLRLLSIFIIMRIDLIVNLICDEIGRKELNFIKNKNN
jgi:hypothetical protein